MNHQRRRQIEALFEAVLDRTPAERQAFLAAAGEGDRELRDEVAAMLEAHERSAGILDGGPITPEVLGQAENATQPAGPAIDSRSGPSDSSSSGSLLSRLGRRLLAALSPKAARAPAARSRSPEPDVLPRGSRIGRYVVEERLGSGGMGIVYRARDTQLDRFVALKFLPAALDADESARRRFLVEAKAAAGLDHPNICTVHEIASTTDDRLYIAMAYYRGATLKEKMACGSLPADEAIDIAIQVARGLDRAHDRGIIHRDIKPANILVTEDGIAKILDFGVAKLTGVDLTRTGTYVGTASYMSPEQIRDGVVSASSDIWSLGVALYEMLAGQRPFASDELVGLLHAIVKLNPISLRQRRPDLPADLTDLVDRCLAKDPKKRPKTMKELTRLLEATSARSDAPPATVSRPTADSAAAGADAGFADSGIGLTTADAIEQEIRFCTAHDGVNIAYAVMGDGPPLVKAANWLNHLEFDRESPVWRHWLRGLSATHRLIRYDERGCGLSDWNVDDFSLESWVQDLETVVDAARVDRFPLLGISQGGAVAITYAIRHPERVSHLILYGIYTRGWARRPLPPGMLEEFQAQVTLTRIGWGRDTPAYRQLFTGLFVPGANEEQLRWFNELQRISTSPENAARFQEAFSEIDVDDLLPQLDVPTLVLHARGDARIPFAEGRRAATAIRGARFVPLDSRNHILLEHEPAWTVFLTEMRKFLSGDR
jgi:pimeloyl-ACP methyl ester carboxylesterase